MGEKLGLLALFWFMLCGFGVARFVVEKNSLRVSSPNSLKGVYECAIGNFGVPQYGGTMVGIVTYPKANQKACKSFDDVDISFKSKPGALPTFLLVDRGDCFFTLKAWNAQKGGAAAILVADDRIEPLITMDTPEEENADADYLQNITIPSALISKSLGDSIKKVISKGEMVNINLDWSEALPHPDERVEYEFWTNSNDECGPKCDSQIEFLKSFKGAAQILEKNGYTQFTPHYITWYCPEAFILSKQCKSQCINHGRYCAPDPEQDFSRGYDGKDVVVQNLREVCFFKVANESGKPWLWWDYVADFAIRCPMKEKKYTEDCSNQVIQSLGADIKEIKKCVGDTTADVDNPLLKAEQDAQIGKGSRGDVTILPTLVINNRQYRGKLDKVAVLKAICAGFEETTEPAICLSEGLHLPLWVLWVCVAFQQKSGCCGIYVPYKRQNKLIWFHFSETFFVPLHVCGCRCVCSLLMKELLLWLLFTIQKAKQTSWFHFSEPSWSHFYNELISRMPIKHFIPPHLLFKSYYQKYRAP
ncbi:hypothetical protein I3842_10G162700 [Carya illinoinensis]|uniref:PA domain-containing protein n=1 Tax=Carya illinoinensis TaxID=32201 RepID=A0A922J3T1_CARIL|nr:hypothetical protein I3842_10G162700 [Carya illinoinensis]